MSNFFAHTLSNAYSPETHWTSARREAAGFGTFDPFHEEGGFTTSFTIPDQDGRLTRFLVDSGMEQCKDWVKQPPIYHIQVSGTKKGLHSWFPATNEWWTVVSYRITDMHSE